MNKGKLIFKFTIYYILGLILFTLIASVTYTIVFALLTNDTINPQFEMQLFPQKILFSLHWYIAVYTTLYVFILYAVHKYDIYIVNKLNEKLNKMKESDRNEQNKSIN